MPTVELKELLERSFSVRNARPVTQIASPLLRELVNFALGAFRRCETAAAGRGKENEDVAPLVLFRHVIEMADSLEVLITNSCGTGTIPVLRSQLEGSLGLSYLLEDRERYTTKALSWFHAYVRHAILAREVLEPGTKRGSAYLDLYAKEFGQESLGPTRRQVNVPLADDIAAHRALLSADQLRPFEEEFQRLVKRRPFPPWYSYYDGPKNLKALAQRLGYGAIYDFMYADLSGVTHAGDMSRYITGMQGKAAFDGVRRPDELQRLSGMCVMLLLRSIREMNKHFLGEDLGAWYLREVKPLLERLTNLDISFTQEARSTED